jgi:hypothetical protein
MPFFQKGHFLNGIFPLTIALKESQNEKNALIRLQVFV